MVFPAKLGSELPKEQGGYDIADALHSICDKLVGTLPHLRRRGSERRGNGEGQLGEAEAQGKEVCPGRVPRSLPSLVKAYRVDKVRGVGFDWDHGQVWEKVQEELGELQDEVTALKVNPDRVADESGDVMFAMINYARFLDVNPDEALERTTRRFIARFQHLEQAVAQDGKDLADMDLGEMDAYWDRAKSALG